VIGVLAELPVGDIPLEALDLVALVGQERRSKRDGAGVTMSDETAVSAWPEATQ